LISIQKVYKRFLKANVLVLTLYSVTGKSREKVS